MPILRVAKEVIQVGDCERKDKVHFLPKLIRLNKANNVLVIVVLNLLKVYPFKMLCKLCGWDDRLAGKLLDVARMLLKVSGSAQRLSVDATYTKFVVLGVYFESIYAAISAYIGPFTLIVFLFPDFPFFNEGKNRPKRIA